MDPTQNEKCLKDILDEMDRERYQIARSAQDRRALPERRLAPVVKPHNVRDSVQLTSSEPEEVVANPGRWILEIAKFLRMKQDDYPKIELMVMLLLNEENVKIGLELVGIGDATGIFVHPRKVFDIALHPQYRARGIILAHNHPSGDPVPSPADMTLMRQIKNVGEAVNCRLKDFLVFGALDYFSVKNETYEL